MPIWPFRKRRRAHTITEHDEQQQKEKPLSEKAQPPAQDPPTPPSAPPAMERRCTDSRRGSKIDGDAAREAKVSSSAGQNKRGTADKENVPQPYYTSREDVTALPMQQRLERSPHLRPIEILEKPQIPYNFGPHSTSQTSVQRHDALEKLSKSNTMRSKRSTADYSSPSRRFSTRSKKPDPVREEEIRSMTTPIPIPKRPGDGPLRRDSKKIRGLYGNSHVSLPPEGSIHSSMSAVIEQRGWEVGSIAGVFSARPAVRLSGLPQYVSNSMPPNSSGILYRIDSTGSPRDKATAGNGRIDAKERRKRRTVGKDADELGASDIRAIMEREAKRKEKRQLDRQEKLDRKLRNAGRERADSERRGRGHADREKNRRHSDEQRRTEQTRARVEQELHARGVLTPPSEVHPALRDSAATKPEAVGLGIGESEAPSQPREVEQPQSSEETPENPFTDAAEPPITPSAPPNAVPLSRSPLEEPYIGTAQAVRMSMTNTPPLSPVYANRAASSASHLAEIARLESASQPSVNDHALFLPPRLPVERRNSDQPCEKRTGTWAAFFRRGGTFRRSSQQEPTSEGGSFSNTSRESMRHQPIPAHLVGTDFPRPPTTRSRSGTPVRTQSKFREDLPEMPISPPDSRTQSPDVTTAAAAAAAARRANRTTPMNIPGKTRGGEGDVFMSNRIDTPLSAVSRGHEAMSASLASIGSEGSWLAGGGSKRQSNQSALSRSFSKRNAEFSASYEELGGDKDAEYLSRHKSSRPASKSNLMGASPDEESEDEVGLDTTPGEQPLTVHGSVHRKPTLIQRDPRLVSREGLVQEYAAQCTNTEPVETPPDVTSEDEDVSGLHTPDQSDDEYHEIESPEVERAIELGRARSVDMKQHARHSRQFSAGSARLLDMSAKRGSADVTREGTPEPKAIR